MKTVDFRDNKIGFKKSAERLRHLWHLDDPDWLQARKEQAEVLAKRGFSRNSAKDNKTYLRYFVSGEYTDYVDDTSVMLLTPFDSKEAARLVFESGLFLPSGREKLLRRFAFSAHSLGEGMPWLRDHLKHFSEGVMGSSYEVIEEVENNRRSRTISPDPSYWCRTFLSATRKNLTERRGYRGYEFFLPYFVSALPHVTDI